MAKVVADIPACTPAAALPVYQKASVLAENIGRYSPALASFFREESVYGGRFCVPPKISPASGPAGDHSAL